MGTLLWLIIYACIFMALILGALLTFMVVYDVVDWYRKHRG
jgi:hypothetical protein